MQSHDLSSEFRERYYTLGDLTLSTNSIWFVLHGYGQLASYFIRKFDTLKDNNIFVIAPDRITKEAILLHFTFDVLHFAVKISPPAPGRQCKILNVKCRTFHDLH